MFVLLEMTRDRARCDKLIEILEKCDQKGVADKLRVHNTSPGVRELSSSAQIEVLKRDSPTHYTTCYDLTVYPRGLCLIINNVEEQQSPNELDSNGIFKRRPLGLSVETLRFKHVFSELGFTVEVLPRLSAKQIEEELTRISKEDRLKGSAAFVLIVISHGENESILGYDACEAVRKIRFNHIEKDNIEVMQVMKTDVIPIQNIVNIFDNCEKLKGVPKLHFFICCRIQNPNVLGYYTTCLKQFYLTLAHFYSNKRNKSN